MHNLTWQSCRRLSNRLPLLSRSRPPLLRLPNHPPFQPRQRRSRSHSPSPLPRLPKQKPLHQRKKSRPRQRSPHPRLPLRRLNPRTAPRDTPTLRRPPRLCLPGAWSCRKLDLARSTLLRPSLLLLRWSTPELRQQPAEFSAADPSLTATDPPADPATIRSAPPVGRWVRPANSPADRVPSIPLARLLAVMPAPAAPELPARVLALAHAPALDHHVPADHPAPAAARRLLVRRHARHAPLQEDAADARSIPRPKKAQ